jgi:hypothetical protein
MPQPKTSYDEVRIPFDKMTFSPDVPSTALGPNEYNDGLNIETDVRGIRSVAGDELVFETLPDTPVYISGGYRQDGLFWIIVALESGEWLANSGASSGTYGTWIDITPSYASYIAGYTQATNITEAWSGTVPVFNDGTNPPFFWLDNQNTMTMYSNTVPIDINNVDAGSLSTTVRFYFTETWTGVTLPFSNGEYVTVTEVQPSDYNGTWEVYDVTTTYVEVYCNVSLAYSSGGVVAPEYSWNYNPAWESVTAGFIRSYNTPNVGTILVAGNLTAYDEFGATVYPTTFQWSQAFGLNAVPTTWTPTLTNVANQLEIPVRGPILDAFPSDGNLFVCSYWDTVIFSPINFSTTNAPILGVRPFNPGRGLLSANCWAQVDGTVYGVDARDIWIFNGQQFQSLGNQRVKNWFYDQLDPAYYDRVYMITNTEKNQIEIYYPDSNAYQGIPNKMLSYRFDLDIWNAPREVTEATYACETPVWTLNEFDTWVSNGASRTVMYASVGTNPVESFVAQTAVGYAHANGDPIYSFFRRDNIKLLKDYSGKMMVHRILPEAVNLGGVPFTGSYGTVVMPSTGSISIKLQGANSVGQDPASTLSIGVTMNSDNPWAQFNQNAYRVNTVEIGNTSSTSIWACSALTWQFTQVEDDR